MRRDAVSVSPKVALFRRPGLTTATPSTVRRGTGAR